MANSSRPPSPTLTESTAADFYEAASNMSFDSAGTATPRRRSYVPSESEMSHNAYESALSLPLNTSQSSDSMNNQQTAVYSSEPLADPIPVPPQASMPAQESTRVPTPAAAFQPTLDQSAREIDQRSTTNAEDSTKHISHTQEAADQTIAQEAADQTIAQEDVATQVPLITEQPGAIATVGSAAIPSMMPSKGTEISNEKLAHTQDLAADVPEKAGKAESKSGSSDTAVNFTDEYGHLPPEQANLLRNQAAIPPQRTVKFLELFRFHTRMEHIYNFIGLFFAIAAGVAIPAQMLIFGNLTTAFTNFGRSLADGTDVSQTSADLLVEVDKDALILFGMGLAGKSSVRTVIHETYGTL